MRFSSRVRLLGCLVALVAFWGLGCRRIANGILGKAEESAGVSGDPRAGYTFKDPKNPGTTVNLGSKEAPADFPKSIPLYPGATILGGTSIADEAEGKQVTGVGLQTKDSPDQVAAFYKARFGAGEYLDTDDIANNPIAGMTRMLTFKDPASGSDVAMTIQTLDDKGASIQLNASRKAK